MPRPPRWLVLLLLLPIQVYLFWKLWDAWGFWKAAGAAFVLGLIGTRATRPLGIRAMLFPGFAQRWEERRHIFQGILFLVAALTWTLDWGPQPWLALLALASLIKAAAR